MDFGTYIKNRRMELGLTLEQVGDRCGVGKSTVRKWEHGLIQNIRRDKIALLASVLQLDPVDLIDTEHPEMSAASKTRAAAGQENGEALGMLDEDTRTLATGFEKMPQEQKQKLKDFLGEFFSEYFDEFKKRGNDDDHDA